MIVVKHVILEGKPISLAKQMVKYKHQGNLLVLLPSHPQIVQWRIHYSGQLVILMQRVWIHITKDGSKPKTEVLNNKSPLAVTVSKPLKLYTSNFSWKIIFF